MNDEARGKSYGTRNANVAGYTGSSLKLPVLAHLSAVCVELNRPIKHVADSRVRCASLPLARRSRNRWKTGRISSRVEIFILTETRVRKIKCTRLTTLRGFRQSENSFRNEVFRDFRSRCAADHIG